MHPVDSCTHTYTQMFACMCVCAHGVSQEPKQFERERRKVTEERQERL